MFSIAATIVSKTSAMNGESSAELELDPVRMMIGPRQNVVDLSRHITLKGPDAEKVKLGDRFMITVEKIA